MPNCALCGKDTLILVRGSYSSICTNCLREIADGKRCSMCGVSDNERQIELFRKDQSVNALCVLCQQIITQVQKQANRGLGPRQKKEEGCFIATAAYGSELSPRLSTLRTFRDKRLKPNLLGNSLVHLYYQFSPPFAKILARTETGRAVIQFLLNLIISKLQRK